MDENEFGRNKIVMFLIFFMEFCKRFIRDPNVNIRSAIPLFNDVPDSKNEWLTRVVKMDEIWTAVQQNRPLKAPVLDGIRAILIKNDGM